MRINQNIAAYNAYRNLSMTSTQQAKSLEKLSSGFRINRAADDAAGLVQSEGLRSQVGGLKVAVRNAQDGISLVQTAEGALTEVHALLQRVRDLSVQSANTGASDQTARDAAGAEVEQALAEINRIAAATKFGGKALLNGSVEDGFTFHVGSGADVTDQVNVKIAKVDALGLGLQGGAASQATTQALTDAAYAIATGTNDTLTVGVTDADGTTTSKTLTLAAKSYDLSTDAGKDALVADVQAALDNATSGFGADVVTASVDADNKLVFSTVAVGAGNEIAVSGNFVTASEFDGTTTGQTMATAVDGNDTDDVVVSLVKAGDLDAIETLDSAIQSVSTTRGDLGAYQNRLEHTISNLSVTMENLAASESRIRDADMAQEMVTFTRHQILAQAGTAMLAQANQVPQSVLSLLR